MNKHHGFSILEVMIAVIILSSLGLGIYRLQLSLLATSQQLITKQLMTQMAANMANQISAQLNYTNATSTNRNAAAYFNEGSYMEHTAPVAGRSCFADNSYECPDSDYAAYVLFQWKEGLKNTNLPIANLKAIVCLDSMTIPISIPTFASPNCSGGPDLVIKIFWQGHEMDAESPILNGLTPGISNYVMMKVPKR